MKEEKVQMRKQNMKLFPIYKRLSWDYLFYYTIVFLFLTQVKKINAADVVLLDSFYFIFSIFAQIPSTFIIEFFGRKNSTIIANVLNCMYMITIIFGNSLTNLIIGKVFCSIAFAIKNSTEPSLLNESIPPTKLKSKIFARINEKGMSGYHIMNAISTIIAGFLYEINPYIPMTLSLITLVIVTLLSILFVEPVQRKSKKVKDENSLKEMKKAFKFVLKSERLKGLLLFSGVMVGFTKLLSNSYEVSMLNDLEIPASLLGFVFAILGILSSFYTSHQEAFHNRFRNKSLTILGYLATGSCLLAGVSGIIARKYNIGLVLVMIFYAVQFMVVGIFYPLIEKYLSNFANKKIDTKIYTVNNLIKGVMGAITGVVGSFLLERMETAYCMIIIGILFGIIIVLVSHFMKGRVGLKPSEYSKEELKYDKLKEMMSIQGQVQDGHGR